MVAIGDIKNTNRMGHSPKSKSKQFSVILISLGVIMLVWLNSADPTGEGPRTGSTPKTLVAGSLDNTAGQRLTSNIEYSNLSVDPKPLDKKIKQISLIGERNSGTRWTWQ